MKLHLPHKQSAKHPWKSIKIAPRRLLDARIVAGYVMEHKDEMRHGRMKLHGKISQKIVDKGFEG